MTMLTEPLAIGPMLIGGKQDAYSRILNWESAMTMRRGQPRLLRYRRCFEYYSGENLRKDEYVQPLEVNYLRSTCEAHAGYLWGQWESQGRMVNWTVRARSGKGDKEKISMLEHWLYDLFSGYEEILYAAGMNQSVFGDCILRPRYSSTTDTIVPESILPEYFHCKWSAHDIEDMRECIVSYPIDRQEAEEEFGTQGNKAWSVSGSYATRFAIYWEHWTPERVQIWVDNVKVKDDPNPYMYNGLPGIVPFVHVPNVRSGGEKYGTSDIEAVLALQDELNRKLGDAGDIVSYAAHPVILVKNYFGKVKDLPIGPDAVWDMGREGDASYLSGSKPPVDIESYIDRMMGIIQDLAYMPAAAFGRSITAKVSALTLAMEMMPVTQRTAWKRLHWKQGLIAYVHMAARLAAQHDLLPFPRADLAKYVFEPDFAPVLPKDQATNILANVSLVSNGLRTIRRALDDLGERDALRQADEILDEMAYKLRMQAEAQVIPGTDGGGSGVHVGIGGKNQKGPGGSPDTGAAQRDAGMGIGKMSQEAGLGKQETMASTVKGE